MNTTSCEIFTLLRQRQTVFCLGKSNESDFTNNVWLRLFEIFRKEDVKSTLPEINIKNWLVVIPVKNIANKILVFNNICLGQNIPFCDVVLVKNESFVLDQLCLIFNKIGEWKHANSFFDQLTNINCKNIIALQFYPFIEGDDKETGLNSDIVNLRDSCLSHDMILSTAVIGGYRHLGFEEGETETDAMLIAKEKYKKSGISSECFPYKSFDVNGLSSIIKCSCNIDEFIKVKKESIREIYNNLITNNPSMILEIQMSVLEYNRHNFIDLSNVVLETLTGDVLKIPFELIPESISKLFEPANKLQISADRWENLVDDYPKKITDILLNHLKNFL